MAELNLNQITDRLNEEFAGDGRRLVFWYDDNADFVEDIDSLQLHNAKILKMTRNAQFKTKYLLERQDRTTNYLIYAPFPKPAVRQNYLEDTLLYSKRFYADRASLLCADLGIDSEYKPVLEQHIRFFGSKERLQRFYALDMESYDADRIRIGIMSAICRLKVCSFDEVLRHVLCETLEDNPLLAEFERYGVLPAFWEQCGRQLGFDDVTPTLPELVATIFVTAADKSISKELPVPWQSFISHKSGSVLAFRDSMMNNVKYGKRYDELAAYTAWQLHVEDSLQQYPAEALVECDVFRQVDGCILHWLTERLCNEDTGARLGEYTIPQICDLRRKMHFGAAVALAYELLGSAWHLLAAAHYTCPDGFTDILRQYIEQDFTIDRMYRQFYTCYDGLDHPQGFEPLRDLVERIYTNEYLGRLLPKWNAAVQEAGILKGVSLQRNFYDHVVRPNKERTVVIISDALRYEVGQELLTALKDDPNSKSRLDYMVSVLPSYTRLGMAALLPHRTLELTTDGRELVDGVYCTDLASRQQILQGAQPNSCCVQFDAIKNMKKAALREVFTGMQVVYVYHDQIDVRGEHTEDEVFAACREAVQEIQELIHRLFSNANTYHFIVTADHGFIYKRDKVTESDKIGGIHHDGSIVKRRYVIAADPVDEDGICHLSLGYILGNADKRIVSFPCSTSVFKTPGSGGQNYVHGGSSPQEILVPVLEVKMERGHMDTHCAPIVLVSLIKKITNLNVKLDFVQSEPVSDVVKETKYAIAFRDDAGNLISQEQTYVADRRDAAAQARLFTMQFRFKNQKYDRNRKYYLIVRDVVSGLEAFRHEVTMDLAFSDDFGFDI
jgi:uncharacterized protein (TIGR02687 family)